MEPGRDHISDTSGFSSQTYAVVVTKWEATVRNRGITTLLLLRGHFCEIFQTNDSRNQVFFHIIYHKSLTTKFLKANRKKHLYNTLCSKEPRQFRTLCTTLLHQRRIDLLLLAISQRRVKNNEGHKYALEVLTAALSEAVTCHQVAQCRFMMIKISEILSPDVIQADYKTLLNSVLLQVFQLCQNPVSEAFIQLRQSSYLPYDEQLERLKIIRKDVQRLEDNDIVFEACLQELNLRITRDFWENCVPVFQCLNELEWAEKRRLGCDETQKAPLSRIHNLLYGWIALLERRRMNFHNIMALAAYGDAVWLDNPPTRSNYRIAQQQVWIHQTLVDSSIYDGSATEFRAQKLRIAADRWLKYSMACEDGIFDCHTPKDALGQTPSQQASFPAVHWLYHEGCLSTGLQSIILLNEAERLSRELALRFYDRGKEFEALDMYKLATYAAKRNAARSTQITDIESWSLIKNFRWRDSPHGSDFIDDLLRELEKDWKDYNFLRRGTFQSQYRKSGFPPGTSKDQILCVIEDLEQWESQVSVTINAVRC
jgi:hypothetical protein